MSFSKHKTGATVFIMFCLISSSFLGQDITSGTKGVEMPGKAKVLLHETFRLKKFIKNEVWPGWSEAPFAVLLVTENHEFLVQHPNPSADFTLLGYDTVIGDSVYVRDRQFPTTLRATFPAVGGVPTIVIGMPNSTESPTQWVLTALHEHFHQWQMSHPGYYAAVNDLDLSGGDNTGQWMLNYPFPYDSTHVQQRFEILRKQLVLALESLNEPEFPKKVDKYLAAREEFQEQLKPADYRYFSFQLWQEGVARYVEYKTGEWSALNYKPSKAFRQLEDYEPFDRAAKRILDQIINLLSASSLIEDRRNIFYPIGAAEALLLDKVNTDWKKRYWEEKFYLEKLFINNY